MQVELKSCPFCGGEAVLKIGLAERTDGEVHCSACGSSTGNYPAEAEAIAAWNTRVGDSDAS